ncbi:MAG: hypothetical protein IJU07_07540, partial [Synergistaceae bacterium]|nr:hypothetical protein [Synergistaceae bacterium]
DDEESDTPEEPEEEATESPQDDEEDTAHSEGEYVIVAELGEISRDVEGLYDFSVVLSDDAVAGAELVYIANSSEPSGDDEIAEFFDETGKETSEVPESRHITISIWLRKNVIYNPAVAVRN